MPGTFRVQISVFSSVAKGSVLNSRSKLEKIARKTHWLIRQPKKLTAIDFVRGMLLAVAQGECSFRLLASNIGLGLAPKDQNQQAEHEFDTLSKNGLWQRVNQQAVAFIKQTFECLLRESKVLGHKIPELPSLRRIIVEDSAILNLSRRLLEDFPATNNQHGVAGAALRLQLAMDLISGEVLRAALTPYKRNDQKAASDSIGILREGDLLIRDLGYFVVDSFLKIVAQGAHYLSRHKYTRAIYHTDENGAQRIDLLNHLRKHAPELGNLVDIDVVMGLATDSRSPRMNCRLVARRVPQQVEQKRLRRIKRDEKRLGKQCSQTQKKLQGWELYITSLARADVAASKVCELYALRWRVEIIFKAAKSHTALRVLGTHQSNAHHVQCLLYAWLCLLVLASRTTAFALARADGKDNLMPNCLSILKTLPKVFGMFHGALFLSSAALHELTSRWLAQIDYHDRYESRNQRSNMPQSLQRILGLELPEQMEQLQTS